MKNLIITMGDPAGIGPEITIKALTKKPDFNGNLSVLGDISVLQKTSRSLGLSQNFNPVETPKDAVSGAINVIDQESITPDSFCIGKPQSNCADAAYRYIRKSIELSLNGEASGVITNPINKESLKMAGIPFQGHTEIFAHYTRTDNFSMVFQLDSVAVAHVTTHCSLREAIERVTTQRVYTTIRLLCEYLKGIGIPDPVIAVGGLNPHAGENGLFGSEETESIQPAIHKAKNEGVSVRGPLPPDTVFMRAFSGEFHGVVSMLHDHGFVALKSRNFHNGVNITIGLPIIRTSVGHGTAFDIAGKGIASEESLIKAIETALKLQQYRN
ncbi:4-hydroxythreonine-4-phosphate dehydrogenase [Chitinispirillum alkaliphilum]|nr:4-hydroxythreonine-4-phosphate dehydrogenase [Chitinispirillum alkaliphilum]